MRKTKAKRESRWQIHLLSYTVLWMLSMTISGFLTKAFQAVDTSGTLTPQQAMLIPVTVGAFLVALAQAQLTEHFLKRSMRGWVIYSMIGTLIMLFAQLTSSLWDPSLPETGTIRSMVLMLSVPLLQALWLRRHVYNAWLWPAMQFFALKGLAVLLRWLDIETQLAHWAFTRLFGLLCGVMMYYLWTHAKDTEKTKVDFAADQEADGDTARLKRLQEREHGTPLWNRGDEQSLQSEAQ